MTYEEAEAYINSVPKFTSKNKPENTQELICRIGHPERKMKVVHVAGTNGKGSVCAFLSTMLAAGGKRCGLFTSPHLVKINERFQINNIPVSDEIFLRAYDKVMKIVKEMQDDGFYHPAYFELLFAIGMVIFEEEGVEYLVLETGLGGRLDATNIVEHPIVTVITSISLDHTEILGDTIEEIAGEKAGIIKQGVPVVYDGREKRAEKVICKKAEEQNARAVHCMKRLFIYWDPQTIVWIIRLMHRIIADRKLRYLIWHRIRYETVHWHFWPWKRSTHSMRFHLRLV